MPPAPKKKRGRPPKNKTVATTTTQTQETPKKTTTRRSKYTDIHKFQWTKREYTPSRIGYETTTERFAGSITTYIYNQRVVYYAIDLVPSIGYQLKQSSYAKMHNTLPSAVTTFLKMANELIPSSAVRVEFEDKLADLNSFMQDPTKELEEEIEEETSLEND